MGSFGDEHASADDDASSTAKPAKRLLRECRPAAVHWNGTSADVPTCDCSPARTAAHHDLQALGIAHHRAGAVIDFNSSPGAVANDDARLSMHPRRCEALAHSGETVLYPDPARWPAHCAGRG